jgi:hypothetical protein
MYSEILIEYTEFPAFKECSFLDSYLGRENIKKL